MRQLIGILAVAVAIPATASPPPNFLVVTPKNCNQRLYSQPRGGPFSVFVFCDDAMGVNIGVINTIGAAGPGSIKLDPPREWSKWQVNDRMWQQPAWATDITSFAWSPDLRSLYVATNYIYGTGALYKLDLVNRTFESLVPESPSGDKESHYTTIVGIERKTGHVLIDMTIIDERGEDKAVRRMKVK